MIRAVSDPGRYPIGHHLHFDSQVAEKLAPNLWIVDGGALMTDARLLSAGLIRDHGCTSRFEVVADGEYYQVRDHCTTALLLYLPEGYSIPDASFDGYWDALPAPVRASVEAQVLGQLTTPPQLGADGVHFLVRAVPTTAEYEVVIDAESGQIATAMNLREGSYASVNGRIAYRPELTSHVVTGSLDIP
ncbi:hypothetical protein GCM10025867_48960 (plasmid) [Frondihabitans sucicola]|uniref:Uncharacterized protein n=1 Tax=Frondihabitans sucicola TaxID=1268041 RepID=A0ABM8GW03_9MICO|nr:hypothetical protein [Frondihabitans sucicola]BDZ52655.1 hypothetical protein GCM10025867_48960 [Frondihabitans sucicola]